MQKFSVSWTVKKIVKNIDKQDIVFNHLMQRKSDQWSDEQRSLLIHSLASDYPIPPVFAIQDEETRKYSILDGKQRFTNISSYLKNEWKLTDDTPNVIIDGTEYEIAGLYFKELPEDVRQELEDANLLIYIFEDCTDDEIEEIFYRLNNGTALTKDQKMRAKLGNDLTKFVDNILDSEFFKNKTFFTKYQLKKAEDQTCILQTLMLISKYKFKLLGNDDLLDFVKFYRSNYNKEDLVQCENLFNQLNSMLTEQNKLMKKIHIPMFIMTLKRAIKEGIELENFSKWLNDFTVNYNTRIKYSSYCKGNTTNKTKVNKRLELMYNDMIDFVERSKNE